MTEPTQHAESVRGDELPVLLPDGLSAHAEGVTDHLPGGTRLPGGEDEIGDLLLLCGPPFKGEPQGVETGFVGSRSDLPPSHSGHLNHAAQGSAGRVGVPKLVTEASRSEFLGVVVADGGGSGGPEVTLADGQEVGGLKLKPSPVAAVVGLRRSHVSSILDVSRGLDAHIDGYRDHSEAETTNND